jgi:transposase
VLAGGPHCIARRDHDRVGMIRTLRVARRSAIKMRTQVGNQMRALVVTAPGFTLRSASLPMRALQRSRAGRERSPALGLVTHSTGAQCAR